jgi:hypothetical protein
MERKIEFKPIKRVCGWNAKIDAGKKKSKRIYDFEVWVDGEHRATWVCAGCPSRDYRLGSPDGRSEVSYDPATLPVPVIAYGRTDFEQRIQSLLKQGLLPTVADWAKIEAARVKKEADKQVALQEAERLNRIRQAGPELLKALQALLAEYESLQDRKPALVEQATVAVKLATVAPGQEPVIAC